MNTFKWKIHQLTRWGYWPFWVIYSPLLPVWLFFSIKARSFFFFNTANPSIKNGGMAMESKNDIYNLIPDQYIPKTLLIERHASIDKILVMMALSRITFPVIVKPDIGMKGLGVQKIHNDIELARYNLKISKNYLIQEFINYPVEVGIFYARLPYEKKGNITGITSKKYFSVSGDGKKTVKELIDEIPVNSFQLKQLNKLPETLLGKVLKKNERKVLIPIGSHTRGAKFIDDSKEINQDLVHQINNICDTIRGFYYGRLDIMCTSLAQLSKGTDFRIIEVNGAGSEPTHMYDARHSVFFGWKEIIRHWHILFKISKYNHNHGHYYLNNSEGIKMLRLNHNLEDYLRKIT
jgi:hypothetical protein